jgi:phosphatidylserine/phosphatidylglycerophosphate/cardiolipin synthase-like enzyme
MEGPKLLLELDRVAGSVVESAIVRHHRRRLRKLGWSRALEPDGHALWAGGEPSPRPGNQLDVLVDGAEAFPAIAEAIAGAREYVHLAGWHVAPGFALTRCEPMVVLGTLLAEMAERVDVRVLVWAGSPLPVFHPTRSEVADAVETLTRRTRIRCKPDPREHPFHCHHEKIVIVDGRLAFVGGIDITDQGGDRYDSSEHPSRRRLAWHDVSTRLQGPAVADVDRHFAMRWAEVTGERIDAADPPAEAGPTTVQVVRTVAEDMYDAVPHGEFRILESYLRALRSAQSFVYLENQFLWSPEIVDVLSDKLRNPPSDRFRLVLLLPAKANNGQDDTRGQLAALVEADAGHRRLLAATIRAHTGSRDDPLYVHAKVGIVDDRWLTVGSANLNAHSLLNDTEMNVVTDDAELVRQVRTRLWAEHLEVAAQDIADASPVEIVDEHWKPIADEQLERYQSGGAATHRLRGLRGVSRRSRRLLGPLDGLVADS